MSLSFNLDQFLLLVGNYNRDFRPLQIVAYILGIAALLLAVRRTKYSGPAIMAILALFWLWTGGVFNLLYFLPLYPPAAAFVALFIVQGLLFVSAAAGRPKITFRFRTDARSFAAVFMAFFALAGYPLLETLWGRGYPQTLAFGLVPCPTVLFTLAVLLLAENKIPLRLWLIPVAYSLTGVVPFANGIREDIGLIAGGILALFFFTRKPNRGLRGRTI